MNKALFLDKDGTLVDNSGYPEIIPKDILLKNDILEGLKYAQEKEYKLIIISNQPWISEKKLTKKETEEIFLSVINQLNNFGIKIHDYFYCPHQTSDNCDCKKPKPKMIFEAAKKHNINLEKSFMIGDMDTDINTAKNSKIKSILVKTGRGKDFLNQEANFIITNLNQIKEIIQ